MPDRSPLAVLAALAVAASLVAGLPRAAAAAPDAAASRALFERARTWVRTLAPPARDDSAARANVAPASGVAVTLRARGRVVGRGMRFAGPGTGAGERSLLLRDAVAEALADALGDETIARLRRGVDPDDPASLAALDETIGRRLALELEVAGPLVPLAGATFAAAAEAIEPGLDGVAMIRGARLALRTPARLADADLADDGDRALRSLALDLDFEAGFGRRELLALREDGVRAFRFRTVHLAERAPEGPVLTLARGDGTVIDAASSGDRAALAAEATELGRGVVRHFGAGLWTADARALGLTGDYRPAADRVDPLLARPRDQALAAFALAEWARATTGERTTSGEIALDMAALLLDHLGTTEEGEEDAAVESDAALAALVARTAARLPAAMLEQVFAGPSGGAGDADGSMPRFRGTIRTPGGLLADRAQATLDTIANAGPDTELPGMDAFDAAVVAWALAERARDLDATTDSRASAADADAVAAQARRLLDRARAAVPEPERFSLMPWWGLAELELADRPGGALPSDVAAELGRLLVATERVRTGTPDTPGDAILAGGLAFVRTPSPRPDAQGLRMLPVLVRVAGRDDELGRVVSDETPAELLRFARQLAIRDDHLWRIPRPSRALGGIRAALWSPVQPRAASAIALLGAAAFERDR